MSLSKNIILGIAKYAIEKIHNSIMKELITNIFNTFMNAQYSFFQKKDIGILANTILKETDQVSTAISKLGLWVSNLIRALFFITLCFSLSYKLTITVIFFTFVTLMPFFLLNRVSYTYGKKYTNAANNLQSHMIETFGGVKLILAHARVKASLNRLSNFLDQYMHSAFKLCLIRGLSPLVAEPIGVSIVILAIYLGKTYFAIPASNLLIILYSLRMFTSLASQLVTERTAILSLAPSIEQTFSLMADARNVIRKEDGEKFTSFNHTIKFNDVSFSYVLGQKKILDSVSLDIKKGERLALIGPSGSGKTTLIDLILKLQNPISGFIAIDNKDLKNYSAQSWCDKISLVPQDPILFNSSIKENLLWGNPEATELDITHALKQANALDFVQKLEGQLDYNVGDRGNKLSGGQRQRIAFARALIRKPSILILDEATSNLDHQSGKIIEEMILNLDREITVLMIAHQIETIKNFDRIIVLENGQIKSSGTFAELSSQNNNFLTYSSLKGTI